MGIDIRAGGRYIGHKNRTEAKSENVYLRLIVKVRSAAGAARVEPLRGATGVLSNSGGRLPRSWQQLRSRSGGAAGAGSRGRTTTVVVTLGPLGDALPAARRPWTECALVHTGRKLV